MDSKQKQGHIIAILIMIIILIVAVLISVLISQNIGKGKSEPKKINTEENTNKKEEPKEETKKDNIVEEETEVEKTKYKYLIDRLYTGCNSSMANYINLNENDLDDNENKIIIALNDTKPKKIEIMSIDEIDMTGCKKEKLEKETVIVTKYGIVLHMENLAGDETFSAVDVENKIKEIFGKNTVFKHQSIGDAFYNKTAKAYIYPAHGCSKIGFGLLQEITKVTQTSNNLYVYVSVGSYADATEPNDSRLCLDYDYNNKNTTCIKQSNLDKKYLIDDSIFEGNFDSKKYFKDNIDKFAKYKYTFEKEDNNYVIKKLEKID